MFLRNKGASAGGDDRFGHDRYLAPDVAGSVLLGGDDEPGRPRAIPKAGGSITVSERTSSGRREAASSEITPPYEWPTMCVSGSSNCSSQTASSSKSTRSTSGPGGKPRRFGATISNRSARDFWASQVNSALTTDPCTNRRRG